MRVKWAVERVLRRSYRDECRRFPSYHTRVFADARRRRESVGRLLPSPLLRGGPETLCGEGQPIEIDGTKTSNRSKL